jgi:hypothetical protein
VIFEEEEERGDIQFSASVLANPKIGFGEAGGFETFRMEMWAINYPTSSGQFS